MPAPRRARRLSARDGLAIWFLAMPAALFLACVAQDSPKTDAGDQPKAAAVALADTRPENPAKPIAPEPGEERHLRNIRQLTFEGENAEAYFNAAGDRLIFQARREGDAGDRIFTMNLGGGDVRRVSSGRGVCTCAYFADDDRAIVYASTHLAGPGRPPETTLPGRRYTWTVFAEYDIFRAKPDGSGLTRITATPGYDAEATLHPDGRTILFTSMRDGDLDLYTMDLDGKNVRRITNMPGYDGGAFFSADGKKIVWRGRHGSKAELDEYRALLKKNLVAPGVMDLYVADADGSNTRMILSNGASNWCPFFDPSGRWIIFSTNVEWVRAREKARRAGEPPTHSVPNFDLYRIRVDGSGLERLTFHPDFDAFPVFSPDGRFLVWQSNRHNRPGTRDTNVFIAEWVE